MLMGPLGNYVDIYWRRHLGTLVYEGLCVAALDCTECQGSGIGAEHAYYDPSVNHVSLGVVRHACERTPPCPSSYIRRF